ncbi:ribosomal-protein-L7/L12-serine acetyltransferase [Hartmannibacter diazotrophicus]|uniref:Ribosomal-protein-L7/L12-serine acetyltransferase n=1 Tax=Hartmannibacter diazotrophicus TaxID=1482074 RepID=A0A2C9D3H5_9HYPH|nr:GNAT family protein [Hartmannibacter diazotrophicus]SON54852.1 ribosomal-protein-L7/L12-serine acetyltransferase [Hartmannibacter diazotrophicus]
MTMANEFGLPVGEALPDWKPAERPPGTPMEGRLVRIERLNAAAHGPSLFDAFALDRSGRNWTYMTVGPFPERDGFDAWLATAETSADPMFHAIVDKASGDAVGIASYLRIDPSVGVIEVGFLSFSPRLQCTPHSTEAMYLMMARVFDELGYRRYEWKCDDLNAASRKAADRLGFSYEGTFRQATMYKGRNRDTAWYSILDREWPRLKAAFEAWLAPENFDADGRQIQSLKRLRRG